MKICKLVENEASSKHFDTKEFEDENGSDNFTDIEGIQEYAELQEEELAEEEYVQLNEDPNTVIKELSNRNRNSLSLFSNEYTEFLEPEKEEKEQMEIF